MREVLAQGDFLQLVLERGQESQRLCEVLGRNNDQFQQYWMIRRKGKFDSLGARDFGKEKV